MSLCVGSTGRVPARQPEVLAASPRVRRAFSLRGGRLGQPEAWRPLPWHGAPFPSVASGPGSQRFARPAFSLRGPSARRRSGLRKPSDRNPRLFAGWEGVASLGLSLPLGPPPAFFLQRGWGGSSLGFLSPFVLRTAGGVFRPVNFSLLSHSLKKASLRLLSGPSGQSLP